MARLALCLLALLIVEGLSDPGKKILPHKIVDPHFAQRQLETYYLHYHLHEPAVYPEILTASKWDMNIENYSNATAVKIYMDLYNDDNILPRGVPFSILEPTHRFEAVTLFNVLFSAKNWEVFFKTASFFRDHINEYLFAYVIDTAIVHRHDTQGIIVPKIYEVFPSFFHNGEIMTTAQRINTHGKRLIEHYPSTFVWNDNVVIRWNTTVWPYFTEDYPITYFTHDYALNTYYYNTHLTYPFWLGGKTCPLWKDRRGEWFLYLHKNIVARYYMERLSNGLGEIPELGLDVVQQGYPALLYPNGIPFPVRPNHYDLDQTHLVDEITKITDYERRIRDAIEDGYIINSAGEHVNIHTPEAVDILGRLIEANVDSPNTNYYKDFISIWKSLLGNSVVHEHIYYHNNIPLVLPSVLELYQTALRDPAFYMIWKRVLSLYTLWQEQLPPYKKEELALPTVTVDKVEVDKLVTYFEYTYLNVTNHLFLKEHRPFVDVGVVVQRPQLNHKDFEIRVHVKSDVAKTVVVRFFLAPKYDSRGFEIPLHHNTKHFVIFDEFTYDLPQGDTVIRRKSTENIHTTYDWTSGYDIAVQAMKSVQEGGQFVIDKAQKFNAWPQRLVLPKGRVNGMPFVLLVYISEYHAPKVPFGTGFDPEVALGLGSGAVHWTDDPLGYPLDRPLWQWQINHLTNLKLEDVTIYHKPTPEVDGFYKE